ncbi:hypothetical protein EYF80_005031 [Liparis tanakae]|uniref:Uncharacterized protein n=1 Tax=Liparis tanakae TaxID=230148 RepID=A0A4Z2J350_9TELE|nr:hypothetical protein EYF80_005031 [Liparis tanakae]
MRLRHLELGIRRKAQSLMEAHEGNLHLLVTRPLPAICIFDSKTRSVGFWRRQREELQNAVALPALTRRGHRHGERSTTDSFFFLY